MPTVAREDDKYTAAVGEATVTDFEDDAPLAQTEIKIKKKVWTEPDPTRQSATRQSAARQTILGGPLFLDAEAMKIKVREALEKPQYSVFDFYHESGMFQAMARSDIFDGVTLAVIGVNALWIWIDTDYNDAENLLEADMIFFVMENLFCLYFTFEWIVRFMAFKSKLTGFKDYWFIFDTGLVLFMVFETWVMTIITLSSGQNNGMEWLKNAQILRLVRLLRLARMARMLRSMPELMILIKGMVAATRSVMFVMVLLVLMMYVFAIAFKQLAEDTVMGVFYFPNVLHAMYSLMLYGTFLDNLAQFCDEVGEESWPCLLLIFIFLLLAACTVLNMLIGILCDMVSAVAAVEKELMTVEFVTGKLQGLLLSLDQDNDGEISKEEFVNILALPEAAKALEEVGVDPVTIVDFTDTIFSKDKDTIEFNKFMSELLSLRGDNSATIKDMVSLRGFISEKLTALQKSISQDQRNERARSQDGGPGGGPGSPKRQVLGQDGGPGVRPGSPKRQMLGYQKTFDDAPMGQLRSESRNATIQELQDQTGRIEETMSTLMSEMRQASDRLSQKPHGYLPGQVPATDVKSLPRARVLSANKNHRDNSTPKTRSSDKKGHW